MARARKGGKKSSVKVNFKGVESRSTPAEGDYKFKVLEAVSGTSGAGNDQIEVTAEVVEGKNKGFKGYIYFPLQENSLWKLHAFLTALGMEVPEDEMDIDLSDLVDEEFVGVLTHETYNGRKRAKLTDFDSLENYTGSADDEDDEDDKKSSKKSKGKKSKDEDDDADGDATDYDEMDEDDLRDLYIERKLGTKKAAKKLDEDELKEALQEADEAAAKSSKKGKKSKKSDDDEDDEPKGKKAKGKKKPKKLTRDEVEDMDEEELQELIDEHDLDVDLDDHKKLKKKISAVIDELESEDLLAEEDDD